jgi:hypothetical protein
MMRYLLVLLLAAMPALGAEVVLTNGPIDAKAAKELRAIADSFSAGTLTPQELADLSEADRAVAMAAFDYAQRVVPIAADPDSLAVTTAFMEMVNAGKLAVRWTDNRPAIDCSDANACDVTGDVACAFVKGTKNWILYSADRCAIRCDVGLGGVKPTFRIRECAGS